MASGVVNTVHLLSKMAAAYAGKPNPHFWKCWFSVRTPVKEEYRGVLFLIYSTSFRCCKWRIRRL